MGFSIKDAKIAYYAKKYHTEALVEKIFKAYNDNDIEDSEKKKKIGRYSAAIAIRNIKKFTPKAAGNAASNRTFELVEKIKNVQNDSSLSYDEKKKKTSKYCLAIAIRRGIINTKELIK